MEDTEKEIKVESEKLPSLPKTTSGTKFLNFLKNAGFYTLVFIVSAIIGAFCTWAIVRLKTKYKFWTTFISNSS